jgi:predicted phage tail protein
MNKTKIKLHGKLGQVVGETWNLAIRSVGEAIRAIEVLSNHKLYKFLYDNDRFGTKYRILINGRTFEPSETLNVNKLDAIKNSELCMTINKLTSIDIVPILEGADSNTLAIVIGAVLIIVGIILIATGVGGPLGGYLIIAGLGLVAAGVVNLLTEPPKFDDFREIKGGGNTSYLFNGPQNTAREGGPVPIGYGRLIVGSQVVAASYEISHINANNHALTS